MKKQLITNILIIILLLNANLGHGIRGDRMWKNDGFAIYKLDLSIVYNPQVVDRNSHPDVEIENAEWKISLVGDNGSSLIYLISSNNSDVKRLFFNGEDQAKIVVDVETGNDLNGNWMGLFAPTEGFNLGYQSNLKYTFNDNDKKYYQVTNQTVAEFEYDNKTTIAEVWSMEIPDYNSTMGPLSSNDGTDYDSRFLAMNMKSNIIKQTGLQTFQSFNIVIDIFHNQAWKFFRTMDYEINLISVNDKVNIFNYTNYLLIIGVTFVIFMLSLIFLANKDKLLNFKKSN